MIRIVSWNIAKQHQPWRELAAMDADIALVQEGGQPPGRCDRRGQRPKGVV